MVLSEFVLFIFYSVIFLYSVSQIQYLDWNIFWFLSIVGGSFYEIRGITSD